MMPPRWLRQSRHLLTIFAVLFFMPACVDAQSSVALTGRVSETVALSVPRNLTPSDVKVDVLSSGRNVVQITLSGDEAKFSVVRVPLLLRSNTGFKISAVFESNSALLDQLSIDEVKATGALVSAAAVNSLEPMRQNDLDLTRPLLVLSGPRISLGGTLESPNNALRVTLLIGVKPQASHAWQMHLTLAATAVPLIQ